MKSNYPFLARMRDEEKQRYLSPGMDRRKMMATLPTGGTSMDTGLGGDGVLQRMNATHMVMTNKGPRTLDEGERILIDPQTGKYQVIPASQLGGQQALTQTAEQTGMKRYFGGFDSMGRPISAGSGSGALKPGDNGYTKPGPKLPGAGTDQQGLKLGDIGYTRTGPTSDAAYLLDDQLTGSSNFAGRAPDQTTQTYEVPKQEQVAVSPETITYQPQETVQTYEVPKQEQVAVSPETVSLDPNYQPTQTYDNPTYGGRGSPLDPNYQPTTTIPATTPAATPATASAAATNPYEGILQQGVTNLQRYAGGTSPYFQQARNAVQSEYDGKATSAQGSIQQQAAQAGMTGQQTIGETAMAQRQIGQEEAGVMGQLMTQQGQQAAAAASQLPGEARAAAQYQTGKEQWQLEFDAKQKTAANDETWKAFMNAAEFGDDPTLAAAYEKAFGRPIGDSAMVGN